MYDRPDSKWSSSPTILYCAVEKAFVENFKHPKAIKELNFTQNITLTSKEVSLTEHVSPKTFVPCFVSHLIGAKKKKPYNEKNNKKEKFSTRFLAPPLIPPKCMFAFASLVFSPECLNKSRFIIV